MKLKIPLHGLKFRILYLWHGLVVDASMVPTFMDLFIL